MIVVGIDPGVTTGYAEWDAAARRFVVVSGLKIHVAMWSVLALAKDGRLSHVVFEDARLRSWFGEQRGSKDDVARLQGAGSVKRDSAIWSEFLADAGITSRGISPRHKGKKVAADEFQRVTGWVGKTNEHGRDAGMLVVGCNSLRSGT